MALLLFLVGLVALVRAPSATELWQAGLLAAPVLAVTPPLVTAERIDTDAPS